MNFGIRLSRKQTTNLEKWEKEFLLLLNLILTLKYLLKNQDINLMFRIGKSGWM
jgi:uracil DNA glycosylase